MKIKILILVLLTTCICKAGSHYDCIEDGSLHGSVSVLTKLVNDEERTKLIMLDGQAFDDFYCEMIKKYGVNKLSRSELKRASQNAVRENLENMSRVFGHKEARKKWEAINSEVGNMLGSSQETIERLNAMYPDSDEFKEEFNEERAVSSVINRLTDEELFILDPYLSDSQYKELANLYSTGQGTLADKRAVEIALEIERVEGVEIFQRKTDFMEPLKISDTNKASRTKRRLSILKGE